MAYQSYPNNAHNGRAVNLAEHEQILRALGTSGLLDYDGNMPLFGDSTGLQTKLRNGVKASIRGTRFNNTSETIVAIGANTSGNPRIDLVVLRLDRAAADPNKFTITPVVIAGTPAASPVAPAPIRQATIDGTGVYDLPLAEVAIAHNAVTITAGNVTPRCWWLSDDGALICTATTRPPASYFGAGVRMLEIDTPIEWVHTGTFWAPRPGTLLARLEQSATQSLLTGVASGILSDVEIVDKLNGHSLVSNTSRYVAQVAGWYEFSGGTSFASNSTGLRGSGWVKNGVSENATAVVIAATSGQSTVMTGRTHETWMDVGDYMEMSAQQTSGVTILTNASTTQRSGWSVKYLGW